MKLEELAFPLTAEAFIAFQEEGTGGKLGANAREALAAWVPGCNLSFEEGRAGNQEGLRESLEWLDNRISASEDDPVLWRFYKSARWWTVYAWERGRREREGVSV
ncbi:hypothetical protein [Intestinimonas butyriciproducens]|uniref:Uncharacterized protein n=1 Tax=Intestinimonas butyriciproducens TaxID=1297617 RepID=A0A2U1BFD5_9FIRM|nr:hypothetical protein [Intestinimonas butyriciproducens]MBU5230025.1 hypothetical protein [Intestinimonas butyriciproducens]MCR1907372.1 hypothetical protein [Intestinimonas butyriciproducens]MDB7830844.1 hypothetical protein [Intestinimonas butyriciproducens]PVY47336.1 hypothetical protein C7373_11063 [Intestinimonas butyriciproducens]QBB66302.1 hypothetical protein SRB521_02043 [Intestinimonas butyriciproducens]